MREMYLWFSIIGWMAAVTFLAIIAVTARHKRNR